MRSTHVEPGSRVRVIARWSKLLGHEGVAVEVHPDGGASVVFDGDPRRLLFGPNEIEKVGDR